MRTLLITRGAMGSGKSTWIRENGLEPYALSADSIRMLLQYPRLQADGKFKDELAHDNKVWEFLFDLLETRMQKGEFTVIDATHIRANTMTKYKTLAQKYRYRVFCVDFSHVELETVQSQNLDRPDYKHVPKERVEYAHSVIGDTTPPSGIQVIKPWDYPEKVKVWEQNLDYYTKIHHIGDLHGCYTVLMEYLNGGLNPNEYYIFTGDYCDRGAEHNELLKFFIRIMDEPNVCFLEGNHDRNLTLWAHGDIESCSKEFTETTMKDLKDISGKALRIWYRKMRQCILYTFNGKKVLCSHGGISSADVDLHLLSTQTLIRGAGRYEDSVLSDFNFAKSVGDREIYQIHGHRNVEKSPTKVNSRCFNLEGGVELGGYLRAVTLDSTGFHTHELANTVYRISDFERNVPVRDVEHLVELMKESPFVRESEMGNISSFNFNQSAFYDKVWNNLNSHARGLFINTKLMEIVARSYDKFFNLGERPETMPTALKESLNFPLKGYLKENGFLGILGYDPEHDNLLFCSKSSVFGEFHGYFRDLFYEKYADQLSNIHEYLKETRRTMVFEVIDIKNNPHIIEYPESKLVLLDIIDNQIEFNAIPYEELKTKAQEFGMQCKELLFTVNDWDSLENEIIKGNNLTNPIEGFVIEDTSGFQFKVKLDYYRFWKHMRTLANDYKKYGLTTRLDTEGQGESFENAIKFTAWLSANMQDLENSYHTFKGADIITLRNDYLSAK